MHITKFPELKEEIEEVYKDFVLTRKVLPSMRSLQFAGKPIDLNNSRIYNCAFLPVDSIYSFSETMFLLLGGTGVGYSVQNNNIEKLPEIRLPNYKRKRRYIIQDSIIGWADSIKALFKSYTGATTSHIKFDFSDIRAKGTELVTAGGKAPGPEPLRICLVKIEAILREKKDMSRLTDIECHDIMCHIADAVLAGGIRRAAMISLFDINSEAMLNAKSGNWWEMNPQRGRANNSAFLLRHKVNMKVFGDIWARVQASGSGEPGIFFSNDKDWGTNPCCEIALRPYQFCNLTEINFSSVGGQQDLNDRAYAAAFIGTLQASYTDFHYLRDIWRKTTERDALLGVSLTGLACEQVYHADFEQAANIVIETNMRVADLIGINRAARTTCVKPAGTTSLVLGTSSGIHAWHNDHYIRRIMLGKDESIYKYLIKKIPNLIEDDFFAPSKIAKLSIPVKAPSEAILRDESVFRLLQRVKLVSDKWVKSGHVYGSNTHNVSCTISVKEWDWDNVNRWMWDNKDYYNGISVLPYDGGTYTQAPFEDIDKAKYNRLLSEFKNVDIDLNKVTEEEDETVFGEIIACAGNSCEI
jgi:ribonucleoside-diphosphate reductase alpha chain